MGLIEEIKEKHERLCREYAPGVLGARMDEAVDFHGGFRGFLEHLHQQGNPYEDVKRFWPQGDPAFRMGMIAVFHPAATEEIWGAAAESMAKAVEHRIFVGQERDARWVYLFRHNPWDVEEEWFDTDWFASVTPLGVWQMHGAS